MILSEKKVSSTFPIHDPLSAKFLTRLKRFVEILLKKKTKTVATNVFNMDRSMNQNGKISYKSKFAMISQGNIAWNWLVSS